MKHDSTFAYQLPSGSTQISHKRAQMMAELVQGCPKSIGREIYLYCSVAKGYADEYSDIEVTFLVDEVQEPAVYEEWLRSVGARVDPVTFEWGGGHTTKSWYEGVFIEAAWRPMNALSESIEKASTASTTNHWTLVEAWHILHAAPLTPAPQVAAWQDALASYPDALQQKLIADATQYLAEPHWYPLSVISTFPLAHREAPMVLSGYLTWTVERALRILFAVNRQWEPDYKWLKYEESRLSMKPDNLVQRVNDVFVLPDLRKRFQISLQLMIDALELVPDEIDVSKEIAHLQEAMEPEKLLSQRYSERCSSGRRA